MFKNLSLLTILALAPLLFATTVAAVDINSMMMDIANITSLQTSIKQDLDSGDGSVSAPSMASLGAMADLHTCTQNTSLMKAYQLGKKSEALDNVLVDGFDALSADSNPFSDDEAGQVVQAFETPVNVTEAICARLVTIAPNLQKRNSTFSVKSTTSALARDFNNFAVSLAAKMPNSASEHGQAFVDRLGKAYETALTSLVAAKPSTS